MPLLRINKENIVSPVLQKQGRTYRFKPGTDPAMTGLGSVTQNCRKSAGSALFSIFLASIVPHTRIELPIFSDGHGGR
jgi:hypothetical protein